MATAMSSTLTDDVFRAANPQLAAVGFRKRKAGIFTIDVGEEVLGWLGLNNAYHPGEDALEVNPVVGVRHQGVERLVAQLGAREFHPYLPPTVSSPIGYLMPAKRYTYWLFRRSEPPQPRMAELVSAVAAYGLSFMRSTSSLDELRHQIEAGTGIPYALAYRLPVVCLMAGDESGALAALEESVQALGDKQDPYSVEFRAFSKRFRSMCGSGSV